MNKLERLTDAFIENIINTPDTEILEEIEEDYGDASVVAEKMRGILRQARWRLENE
jgi:hypothetical protein